MTLQHAARLLHDPTLGSAGLRAACFLMRQHLEQRLAGPPGPGRPPSVRALLAVALVDRPADARRLAQLWDALSRACHAHGHELAPARSTVEAWLVDLQRAAP